MSIDFDSLYYLTICLALISIFITYLTSKTLISAATAYWFAWVFLIFGADVALENNWILPISHLSLMYISQLHLGAFIGFLLASVIFRAKKYPKKYEHLVNKSIYVNSKLSKKVLIALFILGSLFLFERISQVGFDINYLENVRQVHITGSESLTKRIGTHIGVFVSFLIILIAIKDAKNSINMKYLAMVVLAAAPLGLANGGRIFLLNYFIIYLASLLLVRGQYGSNKYLLSNKEWIHVAIFLLVVLTIFSILGFMRGGYGDDLDILYTILIWPVSTFGAMDSWLAMAITSDNTNGLFTLGWFVSFLNNYGILDYSREYNTVLSVMNSLSSNHDSAIFIPKSILPELIFDFGTQGAFFGIIVISFCLQAFSLRLVVKGIFSHTVATLSIVAAFNTIQMGVITPSFIVTLFWAYVFSIMLRIKKLY